MTVASQGGGKSSSHHNAHSLFTQVPHGRLGRPFLWYNSVSETWCLHLKEKRLFLTSLKQTCNEYLIKFSENQSAPKLENRKTSPCSPCAPNLPHVLLSRIPGYHNLCSPADSRANLRSIRVFTDTPTTKNISVDTPSVGKIVVKQVKIQADRCTNLQICEFTWDGRQVGWRPPVNRRLSQTYTWPQQSLTHNLMISEASREGLVTLFLCRICYCIQA